MFSISNLMSSFAFSTAAAGTSSRRVYEGFIDATWSARSFAAAVVSACFATASLDALSSTSAPLLPLCT